MALSTQSVSAKGELGYTSFGVVGDAATVGRITPSSWMVQLHFSPP
ncbi:hypothetical protein KIK84_06180 [Curvibacter sp. CHRR-16]|nr:hypothetical protein [Curvibacter sp. CHRR-16]MBT0569907.1 hypothetical protein [Curvibacter sp. CHRR-16]